MLVGDLTDGDGEVLVRAARRAVEDYLSGASVESDLALRSRFSFKAGVFVTLSSNGSLRGCIGFPLPIKELHKALVEAAVSAATQDPRFEPVSSKQLREIIFEVTVLSEPQPIEVSSPDQYLASIRVGRDGLIVRHGPSSGLLLPQVPIEYEWSEQEFLEHTCEKAGLPRDVWKAGDAEVLKFGGAVFAEMTPGGRVARRIL